MAIVIQPADFSDPQLIAFLQAHLDELAPTAPAESRHALDLTALKSPAVRLWIGRDDQTIVSSGALAVVADGHEEVKAMRVAPGRRGQGLGDAMMRALIDDAQSRGVRRLSLETGSMDFFRAARSLYVKAGFVASRPFAQYREDPKSVFMTMRLP